MTLVEQDTVKKKHVFRFISHNHSQHTLFTPFLNNHPTFFFLTASWNCQNAAQRFTYSNVELPLFLLRKEKATVMLSSFRSVLVAPPVSILLNMRAAFLELNLAAYFNRICLCLYSAWYRAVLKRTLGKELKRNHTFPIPF